MYNQKKQQPVAVCSVCGAFGYSRQHINERCGKQYGARRCMGVRKSASDWDNWKECPKCSASGRYDGEECNMCYGSGWMYIRPKLAEQEEPVAT
jgi:DnaJ-class molecular chaperone